MSTFPDKLYHFGGVPVASAGDFAGFWGSDVWFVDFDDGKSAAGQGKNDMDAPGKDLYHAFSGCGAGDTIYIRGREPSATDTQSITPAASQATNWIIAAAKTGLNVIGTNGPGGNAQMTTLESYAALTTPTILNYAPFVTFENIKFQAIASQVAQGTIWSRVGTAGTHDGFGVTFNRCSWHDYEGTTQGAVMLGSGRYDQVLNSSFWHCLLGLRVTSFADYSRGARIVNNDFYGDDTDIDYDISLGDVNHILIDNNRFHHELPAKAGGSRLKYLHIDGTVATGLLSNNTFATADATIGAACQLISIIDVGNKCSCETTWMTAA